MRRPAYHGEIGREATARSAASVPWGSAYHGEIGREATAVSADLTARDISLPRGNR